MSYSMNKFSILIKMKKRIATQERELKKQVDRGDKAEERVQMMEAQLKAQCGDLVAMAIVPSAILLVLQFVALILVALDLVVALRSQEASLAFATDNEFGGHVIRSFGGRHLRSLICGLPSTCHLMLLRIHLLLVSAMNLIRCKSAS